MQALGTFPEDVEDDLLTPLVPQEPIPLNEPAPLDPSYIEEWTLRGEGAISGTGNTITYKAPANVPENDEAIVSAKLRLKSGSPFHLVSTITIGGSEILLDGGPYSNFRAVAKKLGAASFNAQSGVTASSGNCLRRDHQSWRGDPLPKQCTGSTPMAKASLCRHDSRDQCRKHSHHRRLV